MKTFPGELKRYTFSYIFDGSRWGIEIYATSPEEAKRKMRSVAYAIYDGEVVAEIPLSPCSFIKKSISKLVNIITLWSWRQ